LKRFRRQARSLFLALPGLAAIGSRRDCWPGSDQPIGFQPVEQGVQLRLLDMPDQGDAFEGGELFVKFVAVRGLLAQEAEQDEFERKGGLPAGHG